jgi:hypothetical protein
MVVEEDDRASATNVAGPHFVCSRIRATRTGTASPVGLYSPDGAEPRSCAAAVLIVRLCPRLGPRDIGGDAT